MEWMILCGVISTPAFAATATPAESPIIYTAKEVANTDADGGLRWAVGTHNIQIYRANRTHPEHMDGLNHTYLHAPAMAYWSGKFHLAYLSGPVNEHQTPAPTSYMYSDDGYKWSQPVTLFPAITLPDGSETLTHQRMVFYTAPNGRLLATAFHGEAPSPNDGSGIGRVVREIHRDGSFGQIYWIRLNQHAGWSPEKAQAYSLYSDSDDRGFIEACDALLKDKLMTAQWWEEERSEDGFYTVKGKALSFYTRPDGKVVGIWKDAQVSITDDKGLSWVRTGFATDLPVNSSKYWIEQTSDNNYAMVFNPTSRLRHPLAVSLSADGQHFENLLTVHGELPVQRFPGLYKNMGPQYVRGIAEGNGDAPDGDLWVTYSVNKEDIWVSRVPVPVTADVAETTLFSDFEDVPDSRLPDDWNVYSLLWAPVEIVDRGKDSDHSLRLADEDPYDYARASRVFSAQRSVRIQFDVLAEQLDGRLEVDVTGPNGGRPVQIAFTEMGTIEARHEGIWKPGGTYSHGEWIHIELDVNPGNNTERFQLRVNGEEVLYRIAYFTDFIPEVERLTFRTGKYRRRGQGGHELPCADLKSKRQSFLIDNVLIEPRP
jgi:hypothetical protein